MKLLRTTIAILSTAVLFSCATTGAPPDGLSRIDTIVVIYAENHSFDNMYGMFPGADGVANAGETATRQRDHDGRILERLPAVYNLQGKADERYPAGLPNGPFRIDAPPVNARIDQVVPSPIHNYYQNMEQINGGRNDRFVAMTTVGAWTMGYYDGSTQKMWQWAKDYTLADNFFMGAFGGSFLNHQWLVCACTPQYPNAPATLRAQLDEQGRLKKKASSPVSVLDGPVQVMDGTVTPDGFVVNTSQPPFQPSGIVPAAGADPALADPAKFPVPPQTAPTIGDRLTDRRISWAWYAGGWNQASADGRQAPDAKRAVIYNRDAASPNFQPHHQPFNYFAQFAPGTANRATHLLDGDAFTTAIDQGTLPQVAFYKPPGRLTQHPSYTDIQSGDLHIADLLAQLKRSPQWAHMAVIVTYDENGGYWDHVAPPTGAGWGDRWGPGTRIPTLIVSPYAKRGFVDHTPSDTTSILKLISRRFDLQPLPGVRANMGDLTSAFDFTR